MEQSQKRLQALEKCLSEDSIYQSEQKSKLEDLIFEQTDLRSQLQSLEDNWLQLNEQLEAL